MGGKNIKSTVGKYVTISFYVVMLLVILLLMMSGIFPVSNEILVIVAIGFMLMVGLFEIAYELNKRPVKKR